MFIFDGLHVWSFVLSRMRTILLAAKFSAYQCKWDMIAPKLPLLMGIEAVNMRICHDEENIARFDLSQKTLGSISCSSTVALVFFGESWCTVVWYPRVHSWLINQREIRDRSEHNFYTVGHSMHSHWCLMASEQNKYSTSACRHRSTTTSS